MTPEREKRIRSVIARRQSGLTVILDNVNDPHNIFAVMRTCDSVGIQNIYVIDPAGIFRKKFEYGSRSSASSSKWINTLIYEDCDSCFEEVRKKHARIIGTHLGGPSVSLYDLDLTETVALVFGNEKDGISKEALLHCDQNFSIPQVGMIKSLNISVACAVSLYEAFRQRNAKGMYDESALNKQEQDTLFRDFRLKQIPVDQIPNSRKSNSRNPNSKFQNPNSSK